MASAFLALLVRARPGDVILAKTDPPLVSVLAWLAARLTGARLVNWCQDLFPENAAAMGLRLARGPVGAALRALRNASLRGAEMNVAVCTSHGGAPRRRGRAAFARLTVIPNWADGERDPAARAAGQPAARRLGARRSLRRRLLGQSRMCPPGRAHGRADHLARGRAWARVPVHRRRLRLSAAARRDRRTSPRERRLPALSGPRAAAAEPDRARTSIS